MTAYEDLLDWAASRPWWQQQVLAQLAAGRGFTQPDFEAIAESLLSDPPPKPAGGWLAAMHHPADTSGPPVRLTAIRDVANVNRLVEDQHLTFSPSGVTVVYGNNGSGKSGYARLIKRMVRTRHREEVLPDIFTAAGGPQSACLYYAVGTSQTSALLGETPPADLANVAYYDERCGDAYVTTEGEVTYRPSVLRLLDDLVQVCDDVRAVPDQRLAVNARQRIALPDLPADTAAGRLLAGLSGSTSDDELERACSAPPDADARIENARSEEGRLRATDPTKEARRLSGLAAAYETLARHLAGLDEGLGLASEDRLRAAVRTAAETRAAGDAASALSFDQEPVKGVGSGAWRALWEAARRFSETVTYTGRAFPVLDGEAHCVLCQQPFDPNGADRLGRFERFMTDDTEDRARSAAQQLTRARATVSAATVDASTCAVALSAIESEDEDLHGRVKADLDDWRTRQTALTSEPVPEDAEPPPTRGTVSRLRERAEALRRQAAEVDADQFEVTLANLVAEQRELGAGLSLSKLAADVRAERDRRREEYLLSEARRQTDTRRISRASGDLTAKHVTLLVQDRFSRESQDLRVDSVTLLGQGVRRGAVLHKPEFVGAVLSADLPAVLSEGEQTALGLAGFFVEAHLDGTRSALVLDDPVTSLDHIRREHVARRLVQFARDRQVVVFTHDVAFASALRRQCGEASVAFAERSIERRRADDSPGVCLDKHPWTAKDATARAASLRADLGRIRKESPGWYGERYEREVSAWASGLSQTWERIVSQEVADRIFDRGTLEVRVTMLKVAARITEADDKELQDSYKRCSAWTRHDQDQALNYSPPSVDDLEGELKVLEGWLAKVKKYRQ